MAHRLVRLFACTLICLAAFVVPAWAATVTAGELEVQVWPAAQPGQVVVIVALGLPEEQALPTTVQLPVSPGLTVDWAGEIADDGTADVQREFELKQGPSGQYAEFEVSRFRQCQIDLSGVPLQVEGGRYSAAVDYVQTTPSDLTAFSVRVPAGASAVTIEPRPTGTPERNQAGETLYTLPSSELEPGESQRVTVSYSLGGEDGGTTTRTTGSNRALLGVLLAALAVVIVVLVFAMRRRSDT